MSVFQRHEIAVNSEVMVRGEGDFIFPWPLPHLASLLARLY